MDYMDQRGRSVKELQSWVASGKLKVQEDVIDGLENTPQALIGLLAGENRGKRMIRGVMGQPLRTARAHGSERPGGEYAGETADLAAGRNSQPAGGRDSDPGDSRPDIPSPIRRRAP